MQKTIIIQSNHMGQKSDRRINNVENMQYVIRNRYAAFNHRHGEHLGKTIWSGYIMWNCHYCNWFSFQYVSLSGKA